MKKKPAKAIKKPKRNMAPTEIPTETIHSTYEVNLSDNKLTIIQD
jgi:hypothetical protein